MQILLSVWLSWWGQLGSTQIYLKKMNWVMAKFVWNTPVESSERCYHHIVFSRLSADSVLKMIRLQHTETAEEKDNTRPSFWTSARNTEKKACPNIWFSLQKLFKYEAPPINQLYIIHMCISGGCPLDILRALKNFKCFSVNSVCFLSLGTNLNYSLYISRAVSELMRTPIQASKCPCIMFLFC